MRTLLVSGIYRPEIGGPATYVPKLAEKIIEVGQKVEVITLRNSNSEKVDEEWPVHYVLRDQNLMIRYIKTVLVIIKKGFNTDSIFSNGLFQETAIALLFIKVKSVAKVSGDPVWERAVNSGRTTLSRIDFNQSPLGIASKFQRIFLRWSLNRFDLITCPSQELKSLILSWGVKKEAILITNGVAECNILYTPKEYDVISVSRIIKLKNLDKLIYACARTNSKLAIVGIGSELENLIKLASDLGTHVNFLGQLSECEVLEALNRSRIFALISNSEGLSFALLQAMGCGIPSIVSNVKGNTDVISHQQDGLVVDIDDENSLDKAIVTLLNSPDKLTVYGEKAKRKVLSQYNLEEQLVKILHLLSVTYHES